MSRCIPCEAKAELNKQKMSFLFAKGVERAKQNNTDYVIYEDSEDYIYKLSTFDEAIKRDDRIILNISRFEGTTTL